MLAVGAACEKLVDERRGLKAKDRYARSPIARKRREPLSQLEEIVSAARKEAERRSHLSPSARYAYEKVQPIKVQSDKRFRAASEKLDRLGRFISYDHGKLKVGRDAIAAEVGRQFGIGPDRVKRLWSEYVQFKTKLLADLESYVPDLNNARFD